MSFRLICRLGKVYKGALGAVAVFSLFSYTASATAPAEFKKKVPISLSASMKTALGQETLSGFPVLVRLSTAISGFSYADIAANHSDIAFGTDDGFTITPYPFEIEVWDTSGTSLVWVRVPSLAAASSFNLYYGNGASAANTPSDTWAGYAGVWHLNEASGTAFDSTTNRLDATPSGANAAECVAVSTAPTGTGRQLASAKGHTSYLSVPNYNHLGLGGTFTISAWVKADACYTSYSARYFSRKDEYDDKNGWEVEQRYNTDASVAATTISARGANSGDYTATVPDITKNWAYVVISYNGTTLQYYVNGAKAETRTLNNAATDNGKPLSFGIDSDGNGSNWVGAMDEIRLRGFVPTEAWEAAEYAVVADPSCLVYDAVEPLDPTAPRFAGAPTVVGANGAFTFSATLAAGEGDLYMVFTDLATGVATTNPVATNVSTPDVYAATPSLVAGSTYDYAVLGVSPSGTPILKQGDSPVYAGEVTIAQVADADETTMTNGSFIVSRGTVSNCLLTAGLVNAQYEQGGGAAALYGGTLTHCEITHCNTIPAKNVASPRVLLTSPVSAASPVLISNCLIHDCDATEGTNATRAKGALLNFGIRTTIVNCTVANCTVVSGAQAVYLGVLQGKYDQSARLINCAVFVRDEDGAVAPFSGGVGWDTFWPLCIYNCAFEAEISAVITAQNGGGKTYSGTDCIVTTPDACFRDAAHGDFRLKDGSPLVDMGIDNDGMSSIDFAGKIVRSASLSTLAATNCQPAYLPSLSGECAWHSCRA